MNQATLDCDRLRLVPLSDEHLEHEVELDSDPEVLRYLFGRARTRAEVEQVHLRRLAVAQVAPGLGFWAGLVDGEFVGWWILEPAERPAGGPFASPSSQPPADPGVVGSAYEAEAELGYRLLRRHWRRGLASEGARELIRHGFEDLGLRRIFAQTMAVNAGSRATMTRVGMRYVRTFRLDWEDPIPGAEEGEVEYAITRDEWLAS